MALFGRIAFIGFVVSGSASRVQPDDVDSSSLAESGPERLSGLCQERIVYTMRSASIKNGKCRGKTFDQMKDKERRIFSDVCDMIRKGEGTITTVDAFRTLMSAQSKEGMCLDCTHAEIERFCAIAGPKTNSDRGHALLLAVPYLASFKSKVCVLDAGSQMKSALSMLFRGHAKSWYDEQVWKRIGDASQEDDAVWKRMMDAVNARDVQKVQAAVDALKPEDDHAQILEYFQTDFAAPFSGQSRWHAINALDIACNAISQVCEAPLLEWSPENATEDTKDLSCAVANGKYSAQPSGAD